jgi:hypothetical protein
MKGQHLVIGLVLLVIAVVAAIYFTMMATFNNDERQIDPGIGISEKE